jgi:hypothetical protein
MLLGRVEGASAASSRDGRSLVAVNATTAEKWKWYSGRLIPELTVDGYSAVVPKFAKSYSTRPALDFHRPEISRLAADRLRRLDRTHSGSPISGSSELSAASCDSLSQSCRKTSNYSFGPRPVPLGCGRNPRWSFFGRPQDELAITNGDKRQCQRAWRTASASATSLPYERRP